MAKKRGRPKLANRNRKLDGSLDRGRFTPPPDHIAERRALFSFLSTDGNIDQDVCDGIGQMHALGLLDGHPIDGLELRNIGREWRDWFVALLRHRGFKAGGYERMDKAREREPRASERLDRMDLALAGFERSALMSLLIDPVIGSWPLGETEAPWVRGIVGAELLKRKRPVPFVAVSAHDYEMLAAAIRGLFALYDASLPGRYERRAA
jgi:hypothetical protein